MNREMKEDSNFYMGPIYFCNPQPICFPWLWETSTSVLKIKKKKKKNQPHVSGLFPIVADSTNKAIKKHSHVLKREWTSI